jgi:hypothetical protein
MKCWLIFIIFEEVNSCLALMNALQRLVQALLYFDIIEPAKPQMLINLALIIVVGK